MAASGSTGPRLALLSLGFVLCGMVTVLPGPLLPVLAARWGLPDVQSGAFFTAIFGASTVGAIFSPRRLRRSLPAGYALMTVGVVLLVLADAAVRGVAGHAMALAGFAVIGFGIGLSVTATNLTVAMTMTGAAAGERARLLSLVNLWWGAGAVGCPWLLAAAEHRGLLAAVLWLVAAGTGTMFLLLMSPARRMQEPAHPAGGSPAADMPVMAFFAVFLFLYVGVETVVGGWITTYSHRFGGLAVERASLLVSLYWLALLAGRWVGSIALRHAGERRVLLPGLGVGLAAVALMTVPHGTGVIRGAVIAAGAGFGPVFPIGVSRMLTRMRDHRNTGIVFAICASGGAALPWLTGLVSTRTGSLRLGFAVPVAALAAILLLALAENAILRRPAAN